MVVPRKELLKLIHIKPGDTFSRQKVLDAEKAISTDLGDKGYMFTSIQLHPHIDDTSA